MHSRRSFLARLVGFAAATSIVGKLEAAGLSLDTPQGALTAYDAVLKAAYDAFLAELDRRQWRIAYMTTAETKIGSVMTHLAPVTATHCLNVSADYFDVERAVLPAMAALADAVIVRGLDHFGRLPDYKGCEHVGHKTPLRFIVAYDVHRDCLMSRFDLVGGVGPEGKRARQRQRNADLKRQIRGRLGTYRALPL